MNRRRGLLALWLLLALAGLAAVLAGLAAAASHSARTSERYRQGLAAEYAAESGAVWGLLYLKSHELPESYSTVFSVSPGTETAVRLAPDTDEDTADDTQTAVVYARGGDTASGVLRYVILTVDVTGDDPRTVTVTEVENKKW